jgi:hypothetical protein
MTSQLAGSPQNSSSAEAMTEYVRDQWSFLSFSSVESGSSTRIM